MLESNKYKSRKQYKFSQPAIQSQSQSMQHNFDSLKYQLPKQRMKLGKNQPKYQSIIFLSQRFETIEKDRKPVIFKQMQHLEKNDVIRQKRIQKSLMRKIRNIKTEPQAQLDFDVNFADKIRILRKPVYQNQNRSSVQKINRQVIKTSIEHNKQKIKIKKQNAKSNKKIMTIQKQQFPSRVSKNQIDSIRVSMPDLNTQINAQNRSNVQQLSNRNLDQCVTNRAKTELSTSSPRKEPQHSQRESFNHTNKKWVTKSSFQKMEQDIQCEQPQLHKRAKKSTNSNKIAYIPRSCLYMSMYLRLRDNKEQITNSALVPSNFEQALDTLRDSNAGQEKPHKKKIVKHKKQPYGSFLPKQMGTIRNYISLASHKINNIQVQRAAKNRAYSKPKLSLYLENQKLKATQSRKHENQARGPTIKIDPW